MIEMVEMNEKGIENEDEFAFLDVIRAIGEGRLKMIDGNKLLKDMLSSCNPNEEEKIEFEKDIQEVIKGALQMKKEVTSEYAQQYEAHKEDACTKVEYLNEGYLDEDLILNESILIEKGTNFNIEKKISEDKFLIRFGEHTVVYEGIRIKNPSITLRISKEVYEKIAMVKTPKYLKSLSLLTEKELRTNEYLVEGLKVKVVSRENLVKQLMDKYNLYSEDKITIQNVIEDNLTTNYVLVDEVMKNLGFSLVGEISKIYLK